MKQCLYCHNIIGNENDDQCPECKEVTTRLKKFMQTKMGMKLVKELISTLALGIDVGKVLMLTQDYGSFLIESTGYQLIGDSTKSEKLRKKSLTTLTAIAKELQK